MLSTFKPASRTKNTSGNNHTRGGEVTYEVPLIGRGEFEDVYPPRGNLRDFNERCVEGEENKVL